MHVYFVHFSTINFFFHYLLCDIVTHKFRAFSSFLCFYKANKYLQMNKYRKCYYKLGDMSLIDISVTHILMWMHYFTNDIYY